MLRTDDIMARRGGKIRSGRVLRQVGAQIIHGRTAPWWMPRWSAVFSGAPFLWPCISFSNSICLFACAFSCSPGNNSFSSPLLLSSFFSCPLPAKMFSLRTAQPAQVSKTLHQIDCVTRGRAFSHFLSHFSLLRPAAASQQLSHSQCLDVMFLCIKANVLLLCRLSYAAQLVQALSSTPRSQQDVCTFMLLQQG